MPSQSARRSRPRFIFSDLRPSTSRVARPTPTGTLMKKHQRQEMFSASQPPTTGPSKGPSSTVRPKNVMPIGS